MPDYATLMPGSAAPDSELNFMPQRPFQAFFAHRALLADKFRLSALHLSGLGNTDRKEQYRIGEAAGCGVTPIFILVRNPEK
jgi:hypothetical protein